MKCCTYLEKVLLRKKRFTSLVVNFGRQVKRHLPQSRWLNMSLLLLIPGGGSVPKFVRSLGTPEESSPTRITGIILSELGPKGLEPIVVPLDVNDEEEERNDTALRKPLKMEP